MQNQILAQRYRLLSQLGRGGMGSVWLAEHIELGTRLAVKLIEPQVAENPEGLARFKREAQAAASLESPNIVRVFDYGVDGATPYIAMELLKGESLAERLSRVGRIELPMLCGICLQVGKAISKAHEAGIIHRDLKPSNIFLVPDEDGDIAKLIDFGIAKRTSVGKGRLSGIETRTGAMLGTPFYMSPEQASGSKVIDYRTDIWSLGIIVYECITGERAYEADSIGELVLEICTGELRVPSQHAPVPSGFDAWFARCTARRPGARFDSAREAVVALRQLIAPEPERLTSHRLDARTAPSFDVPGVSPPVIAAVDALADAPSHSDHPGSVALTIRGPAKPKSKLSLGVALSSMLALAGIGAVTWSLTRDTDHRKGIGELLPSSPVDANQVVAVANSSVSAATLQGPSARDSAAQPPASSTSAQPILAVAPVTSSEPVASAPKTFQREVPTKTGPLQSPRQPGPNTPLAATKPSGRPSVAPTATVAPPPPNRVSPTIAPVTAPPKPNESNDLFKRREG